MSKRAAYTLLLVKPDLIARADFGPLPSLELLGFWEQTQSSQARLYYSIESALEFGGKCGREVFVIAEEFWTQTLSLPTRALAGLNGEQVHRALGFDLEALTGIAGSAASIGYCKAAPSDEADYFWVTQITSAVQTQIQSAIQAAGGVLAGMAHPGGLPVPISASNGSSHAASWRRIEVWKDATLCLAGKGDAANTVRVINGDADQNAWRTVLSRWIDSNKSEHSEWLGPQATVALEGTNTTASTWTSFPSLSGDTLTNWLTHWAKELTSGNRRVPAVEPRLSGVTPQKRALLATVIALVCLAACVGRGVWLEQQQVLTSRELAAAQAPSQHLADLMNQVQQLRIDLSKLQSQAAKIKKGYSYDSENIEHLRLGLDGLLLALAEQSDQTVMIEHISPDSAGVTVIEGKCLPAAAADAFSQRLATVLPRLGWDVAPPEKVMLAGSAVDGLCQFKIKVSCGIMPEPLTSAKPSHGVGG
jgi:hypothetical protein